MEAVFEDCLFFCKFVPFRIMATLSRLVIQNFRNIELQELEFCPNVNCISGGNGQGKTNLLDAIYYLSMTKSAFATSDKWNYRHGCNAFALSGNYVMQDGRGTRISLKAEDGAEKKLLRDDKPYSRVSSHIGLLPVVMVSPSDSALVSDSGEERRRFANAVLSQMDSDFLSCMQKYNKILSQRNAALKSADFKEELLDVLDMSLAPLAQSIYLKRKAFTDSLVPLVQSYYERLSGGAEKVGIEYRSDLEKGSLDSLLAAQRGKDRALGYTSAGIQRDDFVFTMNGQPIRKVGSQGQQKSFLVSLKFAQYEIMREQYGFAPILLLDDLFDKLDMERTKSLLTMVAGEDFGQIFISDTDQSRLEGILSQITDQSTYYKASGGAFTRI